MWSLAHLGVKYSCVREIKDAIVAYLNDAPTCVTEIGTRVELSEIIVPARSESFEIFETMYRECIGDKKNHQSNQMSRGGKRSRGGIQMSWGGILTKRGDYLMLSLIHI